MGKSNSKHGSLRLTIVLIGAVVAFGLVMPAYGDGITMTPASPTLTVTENDGGLLLDFTVTNDSQSIVLITDFGIGGGPATGDKSDALFALDNPFFLHIASGCAAPIAPGASCDLAFEFAPGPLPLPVENDNDSGIQQITAFVTTNGGLNAFSHTNVTVTDQAVVPEPASLLLFGAGALVLGAVTVWRSRQKRT